jgi:hypothetical protein
MSEDDDIDYVWHNYLEHVSLAKYRIIQAPHLGFALPEGDRLPICFCWCMFDDNKNATWNGGDLEEIIKLLPPEEQQYVVYNLEILEQFASRYEIKNISEVKYAR